MLSNCSGSKKEMLVNEERDSKSYSEVAVVDNPLYAENEGDVEGYLKETLEAEYDEDAIEVQHISQIMSMLMIAWIIISYHSMC